MKNTGEWNAPDKREQFIYYASEVKSQSKKVSMKRCFVDKGYFTANGDDPAKDIAICEVDEPFELDPLDAWPICLPKSGEKMPQPGEICETTGWGRTGSDRATTLQGRKVKILKPPQGKSYFAWENFNCKVCESS